MFWASDFWKPGFWADNFWVGLAVTASSGVVVSKVFMNSQAKSIATADSSQTMSVSSASKSISMNSSASGATLT